MTHSFDRVAVPPPRSQTAVRNSAQWVYLARAAVLFLMIGYGLLLGGTFNGLVLYRLNELTTVLLAGAGAVYLAWHWLGRRPFPTTALDRPLLALWAAYALPTVFSADPRRRIEALLLPLVLIGLIYYLVVDLLRTGWPAELFIKVLVFVSGFILMAGLWELYRWYANWLAITGLGQWLPPATNRVRAFLGHPNFVTAFFTLLLALGLAGAPRARTRISRSLLVLWSALSLLLVFFTSSRAGWLGCAVSLGALAASPLWSQSYFFRATSLRQAAVAGAGLAEGQRVDPGSGWAALEAGDYALALERFGRAVGLNTPEPVLGLGLSYLGEGRLEEAERALRTAQFAVDAPSLVTVRTAFALGECASPWGRHCLPSSNINGATISCQGRTRLVGVRSDHPNMPGTYSIVRA